jgi:hypothetical protein
MKNLEHKQKMRIKEKHNLNGETFPLKIEYQLECSQTFLSNLNRNIIMELASNALDDADLKNAIYEVIIKNELTAKQKNRENYSDFT